MNFKAEVQVKNSEKKYFPDKLNLGSFDNYIYQINDVLSLNPSKVLIIGDGTGLVRRYINRKGIKVCTLDIDKKLEPDYLGSVTDLGKIGFKEKEFDVVLASHVLEHIPFDNFTKTLNNLNKISEYSIIHLPYPRIGFGLMFWGSFISRKRLNFWIPIFKFKKHKFNGQHYWELGTKNFSVKKIREKIGEHFTITKEYSQKNTHYSYNFICRSRK